MRYVPVIVVCFRGLYFGFKNPVVTWPLAMYVMSFVRDHHCTVRDVDWHAVVLIGFFFPKCFALQHNTHALSFFNCGSMSRVKGKLFKRGTFTVLHHIYDVAHRVL